MIVVVCLMIRTNFSITGNKPMPVTSTRLWAKSAVNFQVEVYSTNISSPGLSRKLCFVNRLVFFVDGFYDQFSHGSFGNKSDTDSELACQILWDRTVGCSIN
jgi:hypothetical protein